MIASGSGKERSLAILFGASEFPRHVAWSRTSFKHSAFAVEEYLLDSAGLNLQREDVLNLFDHAGEPSQQLSRIEAFLAEKNSDIDHTEPPANLIVHYVGHGCFSSDRHHCFALRGTRPFPLGGSALRGGDLAEVIRQGAAHLRRFLFIDCCFAAALFAEFQASSPGSVLEAQIDEELPASGTALLCASSRDLPALAPLAWQYTMFGGALIEALRNGDQRIGPRMSMRDLEALCRAIIRKNSPDNYSRPELHVPRADEGDIANLKIFPNMAWEAQRAAEEEQRTRDIQLAEMAEKVRLAEIERIAAQRVAENAMEGQRLSEEKARAESQRQAEVFAQEKTSSQHPLKTEAATTEPPPIEVEKQSQRTEAVLPSKEQTWKTESPSTEAPSASYGPTATSESGGYRTPAIVATVVILFFAALLIYFVNRSSGSSNKNAQSTPSFSSPDQTTARQSGPDGSTTAGPQISESAGIAATTATRSNNSKKPPPPIEYIDWWSQLTPHISKTPLNKSEMVDGELKPLYTEKMWLTGPNEVLSKIDRVDYVFSPGFTQPRKVGNNRSNGFMIVFAAYGCVDNVPITVIPADKNYRAVNSTSTDFAYCAAVAKLSP